MPPTDRKILREIYNRYYTEFASYSKDKPNRSSKIYVPIDISSLATELKVDPDIIFGRLYYHLNKKHGYKQENGSSVHVFTPVAGQDRHAVNFPLVASLLADLEEQNRKFWIPIGIALLSLVLSVISLVLSIRTG